MSPVHHVWPKPSCKAQWKREEDKARQRKRWEDNIAEWSGLEFGKSQRVVGNQEKWKKLVAKSSVMPQRPSRLRARWDERWNGSYRLPKGAQVQDCARSGMILTSCNRALTQGMPSSSEVIPMKTQWISLSILYSMCFVGLFQKGHEVMIVVFLVNKHKKTHSFCVLPLFTVEAFQTLLSEHFEPRCVASL